MKNSNSVQSDDCEFRIPHAKASWGFVPFAIAILILMAFIPFMEGFRNSSASSILKFYAAFAISIIVPLVINCYQAVHYHKYRITDTYFMAVRQWGSNCKLIWDDIESIYRERAFFGRIGNRQIYIITKRKEKLIIASNVDRFEEMFDLLTKRISLQTHERDTADGKIESPNNSDGVRSRNCPNSPDFLEHFGEWEKLRMKGRNHYLLIHGMFTWGITSFVLWSAVLLFTPAQTFQFYFINAIGGLILCPISGYFFGSFLWKRNENLYLNEIRKIGDIQQK